MNKKHTAAVTDAGNAPRVISRQEFNLLCLLFPKVDQAAYQAGGEGYFVAEYHGGSLTRLVEYFKPIL